MQTLTLPLSTAAKHIIERKTPMGLVQLPAIPGTTHTDPAPAQQVPVILELYYAHAYPAHYYQNPVQVDVQAIIKL